jgi:hypothetical protein
MLNMVNSYVNNGFYVGFTQCKPTFLLGMVLKQSSTTWGRSFNAQLAMQVGHAVQQMFSVTLWLCQNSY